VRAGIYVRVSTLDQHAANQLPELHKYVTDRGWEAQEYVDRCPSEPAAWPTRADAGST
jgi:DNA invertase Pin-like site-specific DNA recombinase